MQIPTYKIVVVVVVVVVVDDDDALSKYVTCVIYIYTYIVLYTSTCKISDSIQ